MAAKGDIIIIGAGHNGLVTAFYLARAGLKPLVLERRSIVGGAAITEEFHPGFRCSTLAHVTGPINPQIARDMKLEARALRMVNPDPRFLALSPDGRVLPFYEDHARSAAEMAKFSPKDAPKYLEFQQALEHIGGALAGLLAMTPPAIAAAGASDIYGLLKAGRAVRKLGKKDMYRLLRWVSMPAADLVGEWFEGELLRAAMVARAIFGTALGPRSAGGSLVLLLRAAGDPHPAGTSSFPVGGMGALTAAMAAAATAAGARIRTEAEVASVSVKDGSADGVVLRDGEEIAARAIISNADPKRTLLQLLGPSHLDPDFVVKMQHYRASGMVAKVNFALDALPQFAAIQSTPAGLAGRIHIGPEVDYLERAFDDCKYGQFSRQPWLEAVIPTVSDGSLAPVGKHVMSVCVQFVPFHLKQGDWKSRRDELGDVVLKTLASYAPDFPRLVLARQVITPADLEQMYGLTGGHIFHGELALDQFFSMRPLLGWARYRTPLPSLYLCGSGTHPGTGINGLSGRNAAREILKDLR